MTSQYERCEGWIDTDYCSDHGAVLYPLNQLTPCSKNIGKDRGGHCQCHKGQIGIGLPCGHPPMTCDYVCKKAIVGCKDVANQLAERFLNGDIVACDGMWDEPGLDAAEEALCDADKGFHICADDTELGELGMSSADCRSKVKPNTFYLTAFGGNGQIYGCGNEEHFDELPVKKSFMIHGISPLSMLLDERKMKESPYTDGPWKSGGDQDGHLEGVQDGHLGGRVYKTDMSGGGILCCRDSTFQWDFDGDWTMIGALVMEILLGILLITLATWCALRVMRGFIRLLSPHIRCCRRMREWDGIIKIGGHKIPLSPRGCRKLRENREIDALETGQFQYFQDPQGRRESLISDESTTCVICWEEYEAKSILLRLNCNHFFHRKCAKQWLKEHRECPVCRQDFRTGEDQRARNVHVDVEEIEMKPQNAQIEENQMEDMDETMEARDADDEEESTELLEDSFDEIEAELIEEAMTDDTHLPEDTQDLPLDDQEEEPVIGLPLHNQGGLLEESFDEIEAELMEEATTDDTHVPVDEQEEVNALDESEEEGQSQVMNDATSVVDT